MSLLWADGFNTYNASSLSEPPSDIVVTKYNGSTGDISLGFETSGRFEDGNVKLNSGSYHTFFWTPNLTTNGTLIAGIAAKPVNYDTVYVNRWPLFIFKDGSTKNIILHTNGSTLFLRDNNEEDILAVGKSILRKDDWSYIEMKVVSHTSNGSVEVRHNGCPIIKVDGIQTSFGSNTYSDNVQIGFDDDPHTADDMRLDDFYVCDGAGTKNNDFLGPFTTVKTIFPDGDDSTNFATTGSANHANHYEHVDGSDPAWDTDYVQDSTTGNRDIYTLQNTSNYGEIFGVIGWTMAEGVSSSTNFSQVLISGNTENQSANITAQVGTKEVHKYLFEDNPDTSNDWTNSTVNSLKFGVEVK
jgi:hypothetical protein